MLGGFVTAWLLRSGRQIDATEPVITLFAPDEAVAATYTSGDLPGEEMGDESNATESGAGEVVAGLMSELGSLRDTVSTLQASVSALDKQWGRVGREQFKSNTLVEAQQQQAHAALEQLRDQSARRESEVLELREQLSAGQAAQRLKVIERILPALDGLDEALAAGARLLERVPRPAPPPPAQPPALNARQRWAIALGRAGWSQFAPPPNHVDDTPAWQEWRESVGAWLRGLVFVRDRLLETLAAEDVSPLVAQGEPFDPRLHVAIEATPASADVAPGTVIAEFRRGYLHGERLLRPAEVVVAREME